MTARVENERTLRSLLGVEGPDTVLDATAAVTYEDAEAAVAADFTARLLGRTLARVEVNRLNAAAVEVVVGRARPKTSAPRVYLTSTGSTVGVSREQPVGAFRTVHPIFALIGACHAAAAGVSTLAGNRARRTFHDPIEFVIADLVRDNTNFALRRQFGRTYLAGAGAVGNAFLLGLSTFDVEGEVHVVDPDAVSAGNLNRSIWFEPSDVGDSKVAALVRRARSSLPGVTLIPRPCRLQEVEERSAGPWLERLVIGVDSRRARRRLQDEQPRDVFDASTTGIDEVVLSFASAPAEMACMGCVYPPDAVEDAHEAHVASVLGVNGGDVREHLVSSQAATAITARYPQLSVEQVEGLAYDTLFKQLCSAGELKLDEERQVLAPLAFVSALAGAYLALEFFLRVGSSDPSASFNYWRASPWASPVLALRGQRPRRDGCECCGRASVRATVRNLWGPVHDQGTPAP